MIRSFHLLESNPVLFGANYYFSNFMWPCFVRGMIHSGNGHVARFSSITVTALGVCSERLRIFLRPYLVIRIVVCIVVVVVVLASGCFCAACVVPFLPRCVW
jgi:hypothetical protein